MVEIKWSLFKTAKMSLQDKPKRWFVETRSKSLSKQSKMSLQDKQKWRFVEQEAKVSAKRRKCLSGIEKNAVLQRQRHRFSMKSNESYCNRTEINDSLQLPTAPSLQKQFLVRHYLHEIWYYARSSRYLPIFGFQSSRRKLELFA